MESKHSLGIVIPIYNVEKYLKECLESVVNQTNPFDEVILVNDGSWDDSSRICEQYCRKYPYVQLINQENQGLGAARNHGMSFIKSEYFIFLDSDDYLALQTVETIKQKINDQDILFYASEICESIEGAVHPDFYIRREDLCNQTMSGLDFFYRSYPDNYIVSACMAAYKKSFLEAYHIEFPEGVYYEDNYFYIKTMIHAERVECISNRLYVRRYRSGSITTSNINKKNCLDKMNVTVKIWDCIKMTPWVEWRAEILCRYLLSGIVETRWIIDQYDRSENIKKQLKLFLKKFVEYWGELCQSDRMLLNDYYEFLMIYKEVKKYDRNIESKFREIERLFIESIKQKLRCLPLKDNGITVGIYGIGKHTTAMFSLYERYIGKIRCNCFYIVSDISQAELNLHDKDYLILSYKHIPEDADIVIVSSLLHMNDMIANLKKTDIAPEKVCSLYSQDEKCDLAMAYDYIKREMEDNTF